MTEITTADFAVIYAISYGLALYTWKDEKGWFSRILKTLLTGLIPIVSLMLFVWKMFQNQESND